MAGILTVQTIQGPTSGANANKVIIPAGQTLSVTDGVQASDMPAGSVLQVINSIESSAVVSTSSSFAFVSGLVVNITPLSATSKILVNVSLNNLSSVSGHFALARLVRDSTPLAVHSSSGGTTTNNSAFLAGGGGGDSNGSFSTDNRKISSGTLSYLDAPATTSQLTYKVEFATSNTPNTVYINRWALDINLGSSSSITVMEIAQ